MLYPLSYEGGLTRQAPSVTAAGTEVIPAQRLVGRRLGVDDQRAALVVDSGIVQQGSPGFWRHRVAMASAGSDSTAGL